MPKSCYNERIAKENRPPIGRGIQGKTGGAFMAAKRRKKRRRRSRNRRRRMLPVFAAVFFIAVVLGVVFLAGIIRFQMNGRIQGNIST